MIKPMMLSVVALAFLSLGSTKHMLFKDCGSEAKINFVDVSPCVAEPCELKKGTNESIEIQFIPNKNITSGTTIIHGVIDGVPVPFPVDDPDVCKEHGITCPMTAEKPQTFKAILPVKSEYPSLELVVKWEMHDQDDKVVYCWELPVKIVSGEDDLVEM